MKSVLFCFATHNHQPIGNFDNIIEEAYEKSYKPFFQLAERYPDFSFGTHFTGILLQWLKQKHPEYLKQLQYLVQKGQLEIISGGFYEPILSVIPPHDQQAQIHKLSHFIQQEFAYEPSGMWLAERVWEQRLASVINKAGIKYVVLDDTHFLAAGLREEDLTGYYLTEDEGRMTAVFPISKALRYTIPFASVDETIKVLRDASSQSGTNIVCFADDGEKFGVWPNTFDHVYRDGWLEEFFRKITENKSWIKPTHLANAIKQVAPKGRIYLPNASYAEMMQWALPNAKTYAEYEDFIHTLEEDKEKWEKYLPFVRGGYWRNFLVKYPEANHFQKHVWRTSKRHDRLATEEGNAALLDAAYDKLLEAECNDPFWHGVFGGIYLTNLRHANYTALVEADRLLDEVEKVREVRISKEDFDCDGSEEIIVESDLFSLYIDPESGGAISELDFKPIAFNATNILNRQPEAYHAKLSKAEMPGEASGSKSIHDMVLTKEQGLEKHLIYDWYRHGCFLEHVLGEGFTAESLWQMQFEEQGNFFRTTAEATTPIQQGTSVTLPFVIKGEVWQGGIAKPVEIVKKLHLSQRENRIDVSYEIKNRYNEAISLNFASEWCFNLLAGNAHDRYYECPEAPIEDKKMESIGAVTGVRAFRLKDEYLKLGIGLEFHEPVDLYRFPIQTVSLSEAGFERVYQGSVILPVWKVSLEPNAVWHQQFEVRFDQL